MRNGCCCCLLFVIVWLIVSPSVFVYIAYRCFYYIRTLGYQEANCTVQRMVALGSYSCECGRSCVGRYPCQLAYAYVQSTSDGWLTPQVGEPITWSIPVYQDDWQQAEVLRAERTQCSFYTCDSDESLNRQKIQLNVDKYAARTNATHTCYYYPHTPSDGAVFHRRISRQLVFYILFWPSLSTALALLALCVVCVARQLYARKPSNVGCCRAADWCSCGWLSACLRRRRGGRRRSRPNDL